MSEEAVVKSVEQLKAESYESLRLVMMYQRQLQELCSRAVHPSTISSIETVCGELLKSYKDLEKSEEEITKLK